MNHSHSISRITWISQIRKRKKAEDLTMNAKKQCGLVMIACTMICFSIGLASEQERLDGKLNLAVRAAHCIMNETHCHCAMMESNEKQICLRATKDGSEECYKAGCASGYKCDCASDEICRKTTTISYRAKEGVDISKDIFGCDRYEKLVPKFVSGRTTDIDIAVYEMFSIFRNHEQFGFGTTPEHKVLSTEIGKGDVLGITATFKTGGKFGIKMRFRDLEGEIRMIDENWKCSETFHADWLQNDFNSDTKDWHSPSITTSIDVDSFDADVPWMWHGTHGTIYCRYVLP